MTTLAYDRIGSVRSLDQDGRLHVEKTRISKANVCEYLGSEIPRWQELGLQANKLYKLYRAPDELEKAAPTFNGLQVLSGHTPVTAANPQKEQTVGAMGRDAKFEAPYLTNSMTIWDQDAINAINDGSQRELSCAYHYDPDMTPGVVDGERYDGVMRNIRGNHLALVDEGRAGSDVLVQDGKPITLRKQSMTKPTVMDDDNQNNEGMIGLVQELRNFCPDLSDDQLRDLASKMVATGNAMKQGQQNPLPTEDDNMDEKMKEFREFLEAQGLEGEALEAAMAKCAAMCEDVTGDDDDAVTEPNDGVPPSEEPNDGDDDDDDITGDEDEYETAKAIAEAMFKKTDKAETVKENLRKLGYPEEIVERATRKGDDAASGDTPAQDRKMKLAIDSALKAQEMRLMAMDTARRDVMPLVGEVKPMASAADVYRYALGHLGMDTKGVNLAGLRSLAKQQVEKIAPRPFKIAADSASKGYTAPQKL